MASFSWKRTSGGNLKKRTVASVFASSDAAEDELSCRPVQKKRTCGIQKQTSTEEKRCRFLQLKNEGISLAEKGMFHRAIQSWERAMLSDPHDAELLEMIAQAYQEIQRPFDAMRSAEKARKLRPNWWVAHQTLGRAQMALGEVQLALRSFSRAVHLNPAEKSLWDDDLKWAVDVWRKYQQLREEKGSRPAGGGVTIQEIDSETMALQPFKGEESKQCPPEDDEECFDANQYVRIKV